MNTAEPRFMSVAEAARFVNLSEKTIRRLIDEGKVPYIRIGASIRIPIRWREQLLRATKGEHASEGSAEA